MKTTKIFFPLLIAFSLIILSCDKIDSPYLIKCDKDNPDPGDETRKVLLEEFTGHKCPNCPEGSKIAQDLGVIYGEQLIVVAIHAGYFARPEQSGLYIADYRTTGGTAYNDFFGVQSYPSGMVNRKEYTGKLSLSKNEWEPAINEILENPAQAKIVITPDYNTETRKLEITTETTFLENMTGTYSIVTYITENGIVSPQKNDNEELGPSPDWEDYTHNHLLRMVVNGTWGEPINNGQQITPNETYESNCMIELDESWVAENCYIVSYVYNNDTKEVIQAEEHKVVDQ